MDLVCFFALFMVLIIRRLTATNSSTAIGTERPLYHYRPAFQPARLLPDAGAVAALQADPTGQPGNGDSVTGPPDHRLAAPGTESVVPQAASDVSHIDMLEPLRCLAKDAKQ